MRVWGMRTGISVDVSPSDCRYLEALVRDRNTPQKHAWRARIVLLSALGTGTNEIMRQTGKSKTCVWRWQERFAEEGVAGLLRDRTRPLRIPPLAAEVAERVLALTQTDPPVEATHWTAAMMAEQVGVSASSVQRIWRSMACSRTGCGSSSCPAIRCSSPGCATWSGSMSSAGARRRAERGRE